MVLKNKMNLMLVLFIAHLIRFFLKQLKPFLKITNEKSKLSKHCRTGP